MAINVEDSCCPAETRHGLVDCVQQACHLIVIVRSKQAGAVGENPDLCGLPDSRCSGIAQVRQPVVSEGVCGQRCIAFRCVILDCGAEHDLHAVVLLPAEFHHVRIVEAVLTVAKICWCAPGRNSIPVVVARGSLDGLEFSRVQG
ncbi:MAG: hypothetical protein BWY63_03300 [Chloroflexi bacterium ADurb.Bin360]|nr:MAG: hypothetical protein BWY63_03300 [Chloroflexi bacterium ADurb.Bin360]